jgi:tetratricopeptide (TPR) repeat protein
MEAVSIAIDDGDGFYALGCSMFLGLSRANLGRVSDAITVFQHAIGQAERNCERYWLPRMLSHLGWIHREMGAFETAREWDAKAVVAAREGQMLSPEADALLNLCADDIVAGRTEQAATQLAELETRAAEVSWMRWISDLRIASAVADLWARLGNLDRADEQAQRLATLADELGSRDYRCAAERIRAGVALVRCEGLEEAANRLSIALDGLKSTLAPLEAWKSAGVLAQVKQKLGDGDGARTALAASRAMIETIVAGAGDTVLRESFLALPSVRALREGRVE